MTLVIVCTETVSAMATSSDCQTYYYEYNTLTGESSPIDPIDYTIVEEPQSETIYYPQYLAWTFVSYSQNSYTPNNEYREIASNRVDNRGNPYAEADLFCKVATSGTVEASMTTGMSVGGELDAIVAKVKTDVNVSATLSASYTSGYRCGSSTKVPPTKVGYMWLYVVGYYSNGTSTYQILDTSTDQLRTVQQ